MTINAPRQKRPAALVRPSIVPDRSLHNLVYARILDALHRGELRPGYRVTEAGIAESLGISRLPVREALTRLANEGLVRRPPRRGTFIARLTSKDIDNIRDARALVEGFCARLACARITHGDAEKLKQTIEDLVTAARQGDWLTAVSLNTRFHETVVQLADNQILYRFWTSVSPLVWNLARALPPGYKKDAKREGANHRILLEALLSKNPDRAEEAFRSHVVESALWSITASRMAESAESTTRANSS